MLHIRSNAESSVRKLLQTVAKEKGSKLSAVDFLDDGSPVRRLFALLPVHADMSTMQICLSIEIDPETGSAVFDFDGTGWEVRGNLNAPVSVVHSAVIYCMRAMLDSDIPLNAGCLVPLESAYYV